MFLFKKQIKNRPKYRGVYGRLSKHFWVIIFPLLVVISFPLQRLSVEQKGRPSSNELPHFCLKCSFHKKKI